MQKKRAKYQFQLKNKYTREQLLIAFIILICFISLTVIFGRYLTNNISDFFSRSKEFYFDSDKLKERTSIYQIDNWSGVDDYTIVINMNSNNNNLQSASYDIGYDISYVATDNVICQLSKTQGIIYASTNADSFSLTITPNTQLKTGDKVIVSIIATSTAQYTKTLRGRFTLVVGKEDLSYEITDSVQSPYLQVRLTNTLTFYNVREAFDGYAVGDRIDINTYIALPEEDKKKCYSAIVTLRFNPGEVLLDITNEAYSKATNIETTDINGKTYVSGFTIELDTVSSEEIRFYKLNVANDYTYPNAGNSSVITVTSI